MTHQIIVLVLFIIISRLANSEMDNIAHRPNKSWVTKRWFKWIMSKFVKDYNSFINNWYLANNWIPDPKWNCCGINIKKTLLSFTLDGWHFHKVIMVYMSSMLAADYTLLMFGIVNWWYTIGGGFIFLFLLGVAFEFFYEDYINI